MSCCSQFAVSVMPFMAASTATDLPSASRTSSCHCRSGPPGSKKNHRSSGMWPFHAALITAPCLASLTCPRSKPLESSHSHVATLPAAAAHCTAAHPNRLSACTSTLGCCSISSMVGTSPPSTAQSKAVESSRIRRDASAPCTSIRNLAMAHWPFLHAHMRAVRPSLLVSSTPTPTASDRSHRTIGMCPGPAAQIRAVLPCLSTACFGSHTPVARSSAAVATSPRAQAVRPPTAVSGMRGYRRSRSITLRLRGRCEVAAESARGVGGVPRHASGGVSSDPRPRSPCRLAACV
mmetsp:Transcript_12921/g.42276  ORF Transcript_12921/g.42276 Transcript_12921/m.42276 type:complete len:292 (-) Transcript_12921:1405-2280(-)